MNDLLQDTLRARSGAKVVETSSSAEHGSHGGEGSLLTKTDLRANTVVEVGLIWTVKSDLVGVGEGRRVSVGLCLWIVSYAFMSEDQATYRANEDLIARLDVDITAILFDVEVGLGLAVSSRASVQANSLEHVAGQLGVGLRRILLCEKADLRQVLLAVIDVVFDGSSEHLSLAVSQFHGGWQDLAPGDFGITQTVFGHALDELLTELLENTLVVAEAVDNP